MFGFLKKLLGKKNMSKCVILVPCNGGIEHQTDNCLRELQNRGYEVWRTPGYSAIDQGRNRMAYDAIYRCNFGELMWIDSDVVFNPDDVDKLRNSGYDFIGGAYSFKGWPRMTVQAKNNQSIVFDEKNGGIYEVDCIATGFMYTKASVYKTIEKKLNLPLCNTSFDAPQIPFFKPDVWMDQGKPYYLGEDFSFCKRAASVGFKIRLDSRIKLGHVGKYKYDWSDVVNKVGELPKSDVPLVYEIVGNQVIYKAGGASPRIYSSSQI